MTIRPVPLLRLIKIPISFLCGLTGLLGHIIAAGGISINAFLVSLSIFILAAGSSALNNFQDRHIDRLMERTRGRPIPRGDVSVGTAIVIGVFLVTVGLTGLFLVTGSPVPVIFGTAALVFYNGIYTPLKKKYFAAMVPGLVSGAMPLWIGWFAAVPVPDMRLLLLTGIFIFWQVPHVFLITMAHREEFDMVPLPSVFTHLRDRAVIYITVVWAAGFSFLVLMLPLYRITVSVFSSAAVVILALVTTAMFTFFLLRKKGQRFERSLFIYLNSATMLLVIAIIAGYLFS